MRKTPAQEGGEGSGGERKGINGEIVMYIRPSFVRSKYNEIMVIKGPALVFQVAGHCTSGHTKEMAVFNSDYRYLTHAIYGHALDRNQYLVISLTKEAESLCPLVHKHTVQLSILHCTNFNSL